jgi:hypothetical protein
MSPIPGDASFKRILIAKQQVPRAGRESSSFVGRRRLDCAEGCGCERNQQRTCTNLCLLFRYRSSVDWPQAERLVHSLQPENRAALLRVLRRLRSHAQRSSGAIISRPRADSWRNCSSCQRNGSGREAVDDPGTVGALAGRVLLLTSHALWPRLCLRFRLRTYDLFHRRGPYWARP